MPSTSSGPAPSAPPLRGFTDPASAPTVQLDPPAQTSSSMQTSHKEPSASTTHIFDLSSASPAQMFGRRFVPPAAVTVSPKMRSDIIQALTVTRLPSALRPSQAKNRPLFMVLDPQAISPNCREHIPLLQTKHQTRKAATTTPFLICELHNLLSR
ncbi:hypothetical protein Q8A67_006366 [Cirrhinus molitorella]|uniref:Uncharacterized protein n=1 Tax=Cirrhinus molitorella TaxID=172907 RepID=A0AA88Q0E7_9TELE|nr:hypothetical protein Q8A67_006366 [Cirrhinus molitorella]